MTRITGVCVFPHTPFSPSSGVRIDARESACLGIMREFAGRFPSIAPLFQRYLSRFAKPRKVCRTEENTYLWTRIRLTLPAITCGARAVIGTVDLSFNGNRNERDTHSPLTFRHLLHW